MLDSTGVKANKPDPYITLVDQICASITELITLGWSNYRPGRYY